MTDSNRPGVTLESLRAPESVACRLAQSRQRPTRYDLLGARLDAHDTTAGGAKAFGQLRILVGRPANVITPETLQHSRSPRAEVDGFHGAHLSARSEVGRTESHRVGEQRSVQSLPEILRRQRRVGGSDAPYIGSQTRKRLEYALDVTWFVNRVSIEPDDIIVGSHERQAAIERVRDGGKLGADEAALNVAARDPFFDDLFAAVGRTVVDGDQEKPAMRDGLSGQTCEDGRQLLRLVPEAHHQADAGAGPHVFSLSACSRDERARCPGGMRPKS